jgi:hypothetical protein
MSSSACPRSKIATSRNCCRTTGTQPARSSNPASPAQPQPQLRSRHAQHTTVAGARMWFGERLQLRPRPIQSLGSARRSRRNSVVAGTALVATATVGRVATQYSSLKHVFRVNPNSLCVSCPRWRGRQKSMKSNTWYSKRTVLGRDPCLADCGIRVVPNQLDSALRCESTRRYAGHAPKAASRWRP